ncbi:GNAT family N-acetyltransferase [Streptomyces sp. NPDC050549]|uniref:GNAT family N-acetyltransferase n=1 Tax=Streptomyces sp. NPDC050549 TaxID=3155406 RepID=UPI00344051A0
MADGSALRIRPARPGDREQVLRLYQELSMESLRFRFFGPSRHLMERAADKACSLPRDGYLALVADDGKWIVGIAEYDTAVGQPGEPRCAEIALTVADEWHGHGVGTLLIEHLVRAAQAEGVRRFTADALADNRAVLRMFRDLGLPVSWRQDGTEVHCTLSLEQSEDYLSAVEARERADMAAPAVAEVTEQCGRSAIRFLVTVTSRLRAAEASTLSVTVAHRPRPGIAGMVVRSGGVGIGLPVGLFRLGIGVSAFVALGKTHDVSGQVCAGADAGHRPFRDPYLRRLG